MPLSSGGDRGPSTTPAVATAPQANEPRKCQGPGHQNSPWGQVPDLFLCRFLQCCLCASPVGPRWLGTSRPLVRCQKGQRVRTPRRWNANVGCFWLFSHSSPKNSAAPWASRSRNERGPEDKGVNGDKSVPRSSWLSEGERGRSVRGQSATPGVPFLDFIWTESCSGQGSSPPETSAQVSAAFWRLR